MAKSMETFIFVLWPSSTSTSEMADSTSPSPPLTPWCCSACPSLLKALSPMWAVPPGCTSQRFAHCFCQIPTESSGTPWSLGGCRLPKEFSLGSNICLSGGEAPYAEMQAFCQVDVMTGATGSSSDGVLPANICARLWLPALSTSLPMLPYVYAVSSKHAPGHVLTLSAALWELDVYKNCFCSLEISTEIGEA